MWFIWCLRVNVIFYCWVCFAGVYTKGLGVWAAVCYGLWRLRVVMLSVYLVGYLCVTWFSDFVCGILWCCVWV